MCQIIRYRSPVPFFEPIVTALSKSIELYFWAHVNFNNFQYYFLVRPSINRNPPPSCILFAANSTIIMIINPYTVK